MSKICDTTDRRPAKALLSTLAGPEHGQYNIQSMSIEETYGFGILQEGQAVAVAKNVKIRPNEFVMPARTVFDLGSSNTYQDVNDPATKVWDATNPVNPLA